MEDQENIKEILRALQEDVAALKAKEADTSEKALQNDKLEDVMNMVRELKDELLEMRDIMDKSVDGDKAGASQTAMPNVQIKGINTPGGMSTEQLQEFKKQTLQINGLQQKMKDLESKLTDAISNIKKGNERAGEMEEKSSENVKDLYSTIDQINNSLSEKIALQRVEMQKIAGDTPKAINYDPFNYGEAYTGDFVDFQSRKRITEIKLLLQSLQAAMNSLRESVKVSPAVDLGYKVVRLDQLLAATGFQEAIATGEASHDEVVVITQPTSREPGRIEMPRKEMFQTSEDVESKWAITDSIMQTMYRLEIELGELQRQFGSSDPSGNNKVMEDLHLAIRQIKDKQLDVKMVKRLIEDANLMSVPPAKVRQPSVDFRPQREDILRSVVLDESSRSVKQLQSAVDGMLKRLRELEAKFQTIPGAAFKKYKQGEKRAACLSCDMVIDPNYVCKTTKTMPRSDLYDPASPKNMQGLVKMPARLRYVVTRTYTIDTSNVTSDIYAIPRPCGNSYAIYWPVMDSKSVKKEPQLKQEVSIGTKRNFIRGVDGHYYVGCDVPVVKSEYQKQLPVAVLKADFHTRACASYKAATGDKVLRDLQYQGKQARITTTVFKKESVKPAVSTGLAVTGAKKASLHRGDVEGKEIQGDPHKEEVGPAAENESVVSVEHEEGPKHDEHEEHEEHEEADEGQPREEAQEFDNTAFFEDENTTENACADISVWTASPDNNNNAHNRPYGVTSHPSTFTNIMKLMSAANAWFPEFHTKAAAQTNIATSPVESEVSSCKNVVCSSQEETTRSFPFNASGVHKNNNTHRSAGIQEDRQAEVTNNCSCSNEKSKHTSKHHNVQEKQHQMLLVNTCRHAELTNNCSRINETSKHTRKNRNVQEKQHQILLVDTRRQAELTNSCSHSKETNKHISTCISKHQQGQQEKQQILLVKSRRQAKVTNNCSCNKETKKHISEQRSGQEKHQILLMKARKVLATRQMCTPAHKLPDFYQVQMQTTQSLPNQLLTVLENKQDSSNRRYQRLVTKSCKRTY